MEFIKDKCSCISFLSPTEDFVDGLGTDVAAELSASLSLSGENPIPE